jgi:hypothetical protein
MFKPMVAGMALVVLCAVPAWGQLEYAPPDPVSATADEAQGLLAIIRETDSQETFVLALQSLVILDPHYRGLVTVAVGKGDRLGLNKQLFSEQPTRVQQMYLKSIQDLLQVHKQEQQKAASAKQKADTGSDLSFLAEWLCQLGLLRIDVYSSDPNQRIKELLNSSEDSGPTRKEWKRGCGPFSDHPSHLTPDRIDGAIQ